MLPRFLSRTASRNFSAGWPKRGSHRGQQWKSSSVGWSGRHVWRLRHSQFPVSQPLLLPLAPQGPWWVWGNRLQKVDPRGGPFLHGVWKGQFWPSNAIKSTEYDDKPRIGFGHPMFQQTNAHMLCMWLLRWYHEEPTCKSRIGGCIATIALICSNLFCSFAGIKRGVPTKKNTYHTFPIGSYSFPVSPRDGKIREKTNAETTKNNAWQIQKPMVFFLIFPIICS